LYKGFVKAKEHFNAKLLDSIPSGLFFGKEYLAKTQEIFGADPFPYGVKANRKLLEIHDAASDDAARIGEQHGIAGRQYPGDPAC